MHVFGVFLWIGLGAVIGFAVAYWGMWYRLARIESDLRHLANEADQMKSWDGQVPSEWVADQLEWMKARNF